MKQKILDPKELKNKVAVVIGTRPSIIKLAPIIRVLKKERVNYFIVHSGQHYSYNMDKKFFEELQLPQPRYKINAVKKTKLHGAQTAEMIKGLECIFIKEKPKIVIVGGDANTNLAGALAARKLGIRVAHVEAGLRSNDWRMPEEHNRVMIDHISEYLFPPTKQARQNLIKDNVRGQIKITGNTIVDAVFQNLKLAKNKSKIFKDLGLKNGQYFLLTIHREENVDSKKILLDILKSIKRLAEKYSLDIIFPLHPRTKKRFRDFGLLKIVHSIPRLRIIEPTGYLDFLLLLWGTKVVLTDSGGIQEEACILKTPCVTLRENTERPETVEVGANIVSGTKLVKVIAAVKRITKRKRNWSNPFGDGKAGERIVKTVKKGLKMRVT